MICLYLLLACTEAPQWLHKTNNSKEKAAVAEVHLESGRMKSVTGWEVRQVWMTDKVFVVF